MKYLHFDCDERVNLFVGPNASGKTTILRAIKGSYSESRENTPVSGGIEFTNSLGNNAYFYMEASDDWPRDTSIAYPYNPEAGHLGLGAASLHTGYPDQSASPRHFREMDRRVRRLRYRRSP